MDCLNKFSISFFSPTGFSHGLWDRDGSGSESYGTSTGLGVDATGTDGSGIDHCGTRTGMGMTAVGTGRDWEQHTSPVQISTLGGLIFNKHHMGCETQLA